MALKGRKRPLWGPEEPLKGLISLLRALQLTREPCSLLGSQIIERERERERNDRHQGRWDLRTAP